MGRRFLNRFISALADQLLLSLLWLVSCLPVVTAPVATAALFEVIRCRPDSLPRAFLTALREYLPHSLLVGYGWAAVGGVLLADLLVLSRWSCRPVTCPGGPARRPAALRPARSRCSGARPTAPGRSSGCGCDAGGAAVPPRSLLGQSRWRAAPVVWAVRVIILVPALVATALRAVRRCLRPTATAPATRSPAWDRGPGTPLILWQRRTRDDEDQPAPDARRRRTTGAGATGLPLAACGDDNGGGDGGGGGGSLRFAWWETDRDA